MILAAGPYRFAPRSPTLCGMEPPTTLRRYVLVSDERPAGGPVRGRYTLARLGVSRRSALGVDRHERLERIAELSPAVSPGK